MFLPLYLCFPVESTYLSSKHVEIMKAAVVSVGRYIADSTKSVHEQVSVAMPPGLPRQEG